MSAINQWSTTAGSNTAAPPDGAPEGWAPSAVNNVVREMMAQIRTQWNDAAWFVYGDGDGAATVAYASGTSFTVASADVTAVYHAGRRVRAVGSSTGTIYGTISSSSFSTNTTVNVTWDSGSLSNEALTISIGIIGRTGQPAGVSTSWTLIESQTASTSASLDFTTGIDSTYDLYALVITDLRPATDGANLHLRMAVSGAFRSTAGDYEYNNVVLLSSIAGVTSHGNSQGATQIQCALGLGNVATEAANGVIYFSAPSSATFHKAWGELSYMDSSGTALFGRAIFGGVLNGTSGAIDGVQLLMSSGNITSATVALYGLRK